MVVTQLHIVRHETTRMFTDNTVSPSVSGEWASLVTQLVKNPPAMQETWVQPLDWEYPLEKGKATHSSILGWKIPWTIQFSSVAQLCPTLCYPMNHSTPGLPVHHQLPEFTQTHVHRVGDAIQPSHPLSSPSPPAPNPSQHQSLFQRVNSSHEVAKALEFQLLIAAAKSLQSCPTLCNPIDGSSPGSPVPGILQARTLEWVAISFSNARK